MEDGKEIGVNMVPPDGGWGWMIVCGCALSHLFLISILQNFTLLFKDRFTELDFTSPDITTLVSLGTSFGMILGILNGPLLKIFGYRKMALVGGSLFFIGLLCTGTASSYGEFIIYFGILSSLGMALTMASFSLAVNSYFVRNRSKAFGVAMTLTGLGSVVMPFVISQLLSSYSFKWTVFILSALSLHIYPAALLLHPVKWHFKSSNGIPILHNSKKEEQILIPEANSFLDVSIWGSRKSLSRFSTDSTLENLQKPRVGRPDGLFESPRKKAKQGLETERKLSVICIDNDDYYAMMESTLMITEKLDYLDKNVKYASAETLSLDNQDPKKYVYRGFNYTLFVEFGNIPKLLQNLVEPLQSELEPEEGKPLKQRTNGLFIRFMYFLKDIYDLDLFHDIIYINTMLGISLAFVGEVMFSAMTPIILTEFNFSTADTATFLSIMAGSDLFCRFIAPFVGRQLKLSSKSMYLLALLLLLLSRASMYLASTYETFLTISFILGIGKGFRSVYWVLVLPDCVPLSKLPSASAFQSLINGVLTFISGPLMGAIIVSTNTYTTIILASNVLTTATIMLWSGEIIFRRCKKNDTQDTVKTPTA